MSWTAEHGVEIFSILFGVGSIGYAIISRILDRKKYNQEVREKEADVDLKGDAFWKGRYDILDNELKSKDTWWRDRYDNLYIELQNEKKLGNEILRSFRTELNEIRTDYEAQRELDKQKYDRLLEDYSKFEEESIKKSKIQIERINQLTGLVDKYEAQIKNKSV